MEQVIEFVHRQSSGVALILVVGLVVWAFRAFPRKHHVRLGAAFSMGFIISEALVGAGLVLFGLVADNRSATRAAVISVHLINTFLLLAALALTAWWAGGGAALRLRRQGSTGTLLGIGLAGALFVGVSGAITALGDTLFPAESLQAGMARDVAADAHFLERLRVIHPVLAIGLGMYIVVVARMVHAARPGRATKALARGLTALVGIQLLVGAVNVGLLAPIPLQIVHLLLADLLWIALVVFVAAALAQQSVTKMAAQPGAAQPMPAPTPLGERGGLATFDTEQRRNV